MIDSKDDKSASVFVAVKPEYIIAATPPAYPGERLELYRNSDISPNGSLYTETPYRPGEILRQPTLIDQDSSKFTLLLRKTDESGHSLFPANLANTAIYANSVSDYAEAKTLMTKFEERAERIRRAHENEALQASFRKWSRPQALTDIDERIAAHNLQFAASSVSRTQPPPAPRPPKR